MAGSAEAQSTGLGASGELVDPDYLRVCADPHSLPFSNEKSEGFENKLAELLAEKLSRKAVQYTWYPMATGFVRKTLGEHRCDVIMGYPQGDELVQNTNPYYRTTYVLVFKPGNGLDGVKSLADSKLKDKKIGVVAGTPPATNLAINGLMSHARPYQLMVDTRIENPAGQMIDDIRKGDIDAGLLWGPIAGFYARQSDPPLTVVPLIHEEKGSRMAYRITMGVRATDQQWKRELNKAIRENQQQINALLLSFGVPLLDEQDKPVVQ
jgi:quinoprotein dehydrogenase-associated probable ABC transporter substrate-binding protein